MSRSFNLVKSLTSERDRDTIVWLFNIGAEKYWNAVPAGVVDRNEDRIVNRIEEMNLLLCRSQDLLILREYPDPEYVAQMAEWGFDIPHIRVPVGAANDPDTPIAELVLRDEKLLAELSEWGRSGAYLVPYAVTSIEETIAEKCQLPIPHASAAVCVTINDKIANRQLAEQLGLNVCTGAICDSVEDIRRTYNQLTAQPHFFSKVIVKDPFGASGKGLYIIAEEAKLHSYLNLFARAFRVRPNCRFLAEGWYEKKADVNYQVYVAPDGEISLFSLKRQALRDTVYIGSMMPADLDALDTAEYERYARTIGAQLYEMGYSGIAGIDSIITSDGTIMPIIEINGRFTLSTYISFMDRILGDKKVISRYFRLQTAERFSFGELCRKLKEEGLLYNDTSRSGVMPYTSGSLPTGSLELQGRYIGRMFALVIADGWVEVETLERRLEALIADQSPLLV